MAKVAMKRKAGDLLAAAISRNKVPRIMLNKKKEEAAVYDDDLDEVSQDHLESESSETSVGEMPAENRMGKQVRNARAPKVTKAAAARKVGVGNRGKEKRDVRAAKIVDEEEDDGQTESQQFLEMVRYGSKEKKDSKKANEYLESFKSHVKEEQDELQTLLKEKAAENTKQHESFLAAFKSAYISTISMLAPSQGQDSSSIPNALPTVPQKTPNQENRLKKQSELSLKGASQLVAYYEGCEELLKTLRETFPMGGRWKDGVKKAKGILEAGKLVGEKKVEGVMIGGTRGSKLAGRETEVGEGEALYENQIDVGAWVRVAKKQEKVVKKMTRLLPE